MAGDYTSQITSALSLIQRKGLGLVLTQGAIVTDPVTQVQTGSSSNYDCSGVVFPVSQSTLGKMSVEVKQKLLTRKSFEVILAAGGLAVTPKPGDRLGPYLGLTWEIVATNPLAPSGTPIIHQLLIIH